MASLILYSSLTKYSWLSGSGVRLTEKLMLMLELYLQGKKNQVAEVTPEGEIAKMDKLLALVREPDASKKN